MPRAATAKDLPYQLDPADPFERAIIRMVETNRKKRADYASDDDIFKNFKYVANVLNLPGYDRVEDCLTMIIRKVGRIVNLRGRGAQNESVEDSWMDLAVYAALGYAMVLEDKET